MKPDCNKPSYGFADFKSNYQDPNYLTQLLLSEQSITYRYKPDYDNSRLKTINRFKGEIDIRLSYFNFNYPIGQPSYFKNPDPSYYHQYMVISMMYLDKNFNFYKDRNNEVIDILLGNIAN